MARNEEKAQLMLNRWVSLKKAFSSTGASSGERRPYLASDCDSVTDAEKWRMQIVRSITRKVSEIQNVGLGEHKIRDLNDQINRLLKEKAKWQKRIRELGGPDYFALEPPNRDADGRVVQGGYRYFGAAKTLPGVKELFQPPGGEKKVSKGPRHVVTSDYYGFRDEVFFPDLRAAEEAKERELKNAENHGEDDTLEDDDDDDPALEAKLLEEVANLHRAIFQQQQQQGGTLLKGDPAPPPPSSRPPPEDAGLASRKRDLLAFLEDDDDDDAAASGPVEEPRQKKQSS